jgi:hypothetical protein
VSVEFTGGCMRSYAVYGKQILKNVSYEVGVYFSGMNYNYLGISFVDAYYQSH